MIEILLMAYLIVGLFVAISLWTVLIISKRADESQIMKFKTEKHNPPFASKTEPIHPHLS